MDAAGKFAQLIQGPEESIALDEAALLVAATIEPDVDVALWLAALDDLADRCAEQSFAGVVHHLAREGFRGDRTDYYDPRNSYLDAVLERRRGIPITLSIVTIEIGRRLGVPIVGIGMPGHFIVRDGRDDDAFADPFNGVVLDRAGCAQLLSVVQPGVAFDDSFLAPVAERAIVTRLLANLKGIHAATRDRAALIAVLQLRLAIPGVPMQERRELASALAADGRFLEAATALDELAAIARDRGAESLVQEAQQGAIRLRARLN
jgi:regulator of sirC expression with transglutaminase-like and TPR domain